MEYMQMERFGGAGHSEEIIKRLSENGLLIGIDRDKEALRAAKKRLEKYKNVKQNKQHMKNKPVR